MKSQKKLLIVIVSILIFLNAGIYLVITYTHLQPIDPVRQLKAMVFGVSAIAYLLLGAWMLKNMFYSRAPFVVTILLSVALIGLFVASKTIQLPVVGIDTDLDLVDMTSKVTQGVIMIISLIVLIIWNREKPRLQDGSISS
ncbi:MAG TPA: hypothetical protein VFX64_01615 [Candidatus Nitrosotalea sp.]|nr:hypothetical protein [Candidatus Nitrosotalea sp.]